MYNDQNLTLEQLESKIHTYFKKSVTPHHFQTALEYSVFPAGKLFRPLLVLAMAKDQKLITENHYLLASALELHHAYSLVHDDLPAMDNDEYRRGRLTTHKKFGEWQAILAGDALLVQSFEILHRVQHKNSNQLNRLFSWATGNKGLILGQFLDLGLENKTFESLLRIHELKTARLFQIALCGAYLLSTTEYNSHIFKTNFKMGSKLGIFFQLIDDVVEIAEGNNSEHELEINPWHNPEYKTQCQKTIIDCLQYLEINAGANLKQVIIPYLKKIISTLEDNTENINQSKIDLNPVLVALNSFN